MEMDVRECGNIDYEQFFEPHEIETFKKYGKDISQSISKYINNPTVWKPSKFRMNRTINNFIYKK